MITKADLVRMYPSPPDKQPRPLLHCLNCNGEYSANPGDYFMHPADYVFTCCDEPCELVVREVVVKYSGYRKVEP